MRNEELTFPKGGTSFPRLAFSVVHAGDGFTLIEVLAAIALLAMAVTVVLQLFSANLRALSTSEDYVLAAAKADAKMRQVLDDDKLSESSWSERTDDGYTINVSVSEAMKERTDNLQVKLLDITMTTSWAVGAKTKSITLRTMKTVEKKI
ncbi:MAG TPA: prepilin-type N-terminal cleavage/methylation domain-containing protein [Thermodesulfovibrionales bacterium]|nr:prepilin-type N-terminal cleavage/methylation domain-containing protein [Thermodesulfovibrionales bacterium]